MKKKLLITLSIIIVLLVLITLFIINMNKENREKEIEKVEVATETFTITDAGTEIEVLFDNKNSEDIIVSEVTTKLYDSLNKEITTLKYEKQIKIKANSRKTIKIISEEKYPSTAAIKYKLK